MVPCPFQTDRALLTPLAISIGYKAYDLASRCFTYPEDDAGWRTCQLRRVAYQRACVALSLDLAPISRKNHNCARGSIYNACGHTCNVMRRQCTPNHALILQRSHKMCSVRWAGFLVCGPSVLGFTDMWQHAGPLLNLETMCNLGNSGWAHGSVRINASQRVGNVCTALNTRYTPAGAHCRRISGSIHCFCCRRLSGRTGSSGTDAHTSCNCGRERVSRDK